MSRGHCVRFFPVWQMMIIPVRQSDCFLARVSSSNMCIAALLEDYQFWPVENPKKPVSHVWKKDKFLLVNIIQIQVNQNMFFLFCEVTLKSKHMRAFQGSLQKGIINQKEPNTIYLWKNRLTTTQRSQHPVPCHGAMVPSSQPSRCKTFNSSKKCVFFCQKGWWGLDLGEV